MVDLAQSIQDLGLAGIIVLIVVVAAVGLAKQVWVPGWIYRQERDARIVSDTQAVRNAESLAKSSEAYVELSGAFTALSKSYNDLRRAVTDDRRLPRRPPAAQPASLDDPG